MFQNNCCRLCLLCKLFPVAAEKTASLPGSPLTPLQPLCISPIGAISPPLELPSHLRDIQASSFYKTSGGRSSATCLQRQSAQEVCLARSWAALKSSMSIVNLDFIFKDKYSTGDLLKCFLACNLFFIPLFCSRVLI